MSPHTRYALHPQHATHAAYPRFEGKTDADVVIELYLYLQRTNPPAYAELQTIYTTLQRDTTTFWPAMLTLRGLYLRDKPVKPEDCAVIQRAVPAANFDLLYHAIQQIHRGFLVLATIVSASPYFTFHPFPLIFLVASYIPPSRAIAVSGTNYRSCRFRAGSSLSPQSRLLLLTSLNSASFPT
jgi:hypothetical protein